MNTVISEAKWCWKVAYSNHNYKIQHKSSWTHHVNISNQRYFFETAKRALCSRKRFRKKLMLDAQKKRTGDGLDILVTQCIHICGLQTGTTTAAAWGFSQLPIAFWGLSSSKDYMPPIKSNLEGDLSKYRVIACNNGDFCGRYWRRCWAWCWRTAHFWKKSIESHDNIEQFSASWK